MEEIRICQKINFFKAKFLYQAVLVFLGFAIVIPALAYFIVYVLAQEQTEEISTCVIEYDYRVPCGFNPGVVEMGNLTIYNCGNLNCCFDNFTKTCYHYFTSKYGYKHVGDINMNKYTSKKTMTPLEFPMYSNMFIEVDSTTNYIDFNLRSSNDPKQSTNIFTENTHFPGVVYQVSNTDLTIDVYRQDNPDKNMLTTTRGPLIASDGYWEWTVQLTNRNNTLYGLGGLQIIGNVTKVIYRNEADHSNIPFFLAQEQNAGDIQYHALIVKHKGVLEVQVLESKLIIFRALNATNEGLSLRFFPGPKLEDVQRQVVGNSTPEVIPRWMLGTHICRNNVTDLLGMITEFANEQQFDYLHADSDCFNEMLMIVLIETYEVKTYSNLLRATIQKHLKKRFILPFSPHIPIKPTATETEPVRENYFFYTKAVVMDVLLKNSTGQIQTGLYKNRRVAFFDTTSTNATEYLTLLLQMVNDHIMELPDIEGVFLLDNWLQDDSYNFLPRNESLQYYNNDITQAVNRTPGILLKNQDLFVKSQIELFRGDDVKKLFRKKLPIFSAAHYNGFGTYSLPQHVNKSWANLKDITTRTLITNLFSSQVTLNPVCGTDPGLQDTMHDNELCARWFINQATMPGLRVTTNWYTHLNFTKTSRNMVNKALEMKKMLSYYQYTVLRDKGNIIRPMFSGFPNDNQTWSIDDQYLMGDLVVVPIYLPQTTMRRFYLPINHTWFEFWGGKNINNGWKNISVSKNERLLFLKEGSAIPVLKESSSTEPYFDLMIAKQCAFGRQAIKGSIFFENHFLNFEVLDTSLDVSNILEVQTDIDCEGSTRRHPHVIRKLEMHDCNNEIINLKFEMKFDICQQDKNQVSIKFKVA